MMENASCGSGRKTQSALNSERTTQVGADGWDKMKQIWDRLRPKVEAKPAALEDLQDVTDFPQDEDMQTVMRVQLKKLLDSDASLAEDLEKLFLEVNYRAEVHGSGAIAQGEGAVAAGEGGIAVGGDVHGGIKIDK